MNELIGLKKVLKTIFSQSKKRKHLLSRIGIVFFAFPLLLLLSGCPTDPLCDDENPDFDEDGHCISRDCDDFDESVHIGAEDLTIDGIDQDCDGVDGLDRDGDGYVSASAGGDDCNDGEVLIYPTVQKINGGFDNTCESSGTTDVTQEDMASFRIDFIDIGLNRRPTIALGDLDLDGIDDVILSAPAYSRLGFDYGGRVMIFLSTRYHEIYRERLGLSEDDIADESKITLETLAKNGIAQLRAEDASVTLYGAVPQMNLGSYVSFFRSLPREEAAEDAESVNENYLVIGAFGIEMQESFVGVGRWQGTVNDNNGGYLILKARESADWRSEYIIGDDQTVLDIASHSEKVVASIYDDRSGGILEESQLSVIIGPPARQLSIVNIPTTASAFYNPRIFATCDSSDGENTYLMFSYSARMMRAVPFERLGTLTRLDPDLDPGVDPGDSFFGAGTNPAEYELSPYGFLVFDTRYSPDSMGKDFTCGDLNNDNITDFILTGENTDSLIVIQGQENWGGRAIRMSGVRGDSDTKPHFPLISGASDSEQVNYLVFWDGEGAGDSLAEFGSSVSLNDLNGDGIVDLTISVPGADYSSSASDEGIVYNVFGHFGFFGMEGDPRGSEFLLDSRLVNFWSSSVVPLGFSGFNIIGHDPGFLELGVGHGVQVADINNDDNVDFLVGTSSQESAFFLDGARIEEELGSSMGVGELDVNEVITQRIVEDELSYFGQFIFGGGDVNGDHLPDSVLRAQQTTEYLEDSGAYYFYLGFGGERR